MYFILYCLIHYYIMYVLEIQRFIEFEIYIFTFNFYNSLMV